MTPYYSLPLMHERVRQNLYYVWHQTLAAWLDCQMLHELLAYGLHETYPLCWRLSLLKSCTREPYRFATTVHWLVF